MTIAGFLQQVQRSLQGNGMKTDLSKRASSTTLPGISSETGIIGMRQASDFGAFYMISLFSGEIADIPCSISCRIIYQILTHMWNC